MAKITLPDILASFASVTKLNQFFDTIEEHLNSRVLYRDNPTGEPNQMENDLDMNSNDILNAGTVDVASLKINNQPVVSGEPLNYVSRIDSVALAADGQTDLTFSAPVAVSSFYLSEASGERGRIFLGDDYTLVDGYTIRLSGSFLAGDIVHMVYAELGTPEAATSADVVQYLPQGSALATTVAAALDRAPKTFATVEEMVDFASAAEGDYASVDEYYAGSNSGRLFFKAVALGTGTEDGGSYIDGTGVQWKQNLPKIIDVRLFGLAPTVIDNGVQFQKCVDYVMGTGGGHIHFSPGDFSFLTRTTTSVDLGVGSVKGLTITGSGRGVTTIRLKNSDGFFKWENLAARDINVTLKDFTVAFNNNGSCGIPFEFYSVPGGNHHHRDLFAQNIAGVPVDASVDYVDRFFLCTGLWRPHFHSVTSSGPFGVIPEATQKLGTAVFDVPDCYAPTFERCYAWGCEYGFRSVITANPGGEGFTAVECVADANVGFYRESPGVEPGFTIKFCHANCNEAGIRLVRSKLATITGCLLYNEETDAYTDVDLIETDDVTLSDNTYHFTGNPNRAMISVDANCSNIFIEDEKFRANGTAIKLAAGCDEIHIREPWFNSDVNTRISDLGATNLTVRHDKVYRAHASLSSSASIPSAANTTVAFDNEISDNAGFFSGGGLMVVPDNFGINKVRISANIKIQSNASGIRMARITKNGTAFDGGAEVSVSAASAGQTVISLNTGAIDVADGDVFRVVVYQDSSVALNIVPDGSTWFMIESV